MAAAKMTPEPTTLPTMESAWRRQNGSAHKTPATNGTVADTVIQNQFRP